MMNFEIYKKVSLLHAFWLAYEIPRLTKGKEHFTSIDKLSIWLHYCSAWPFLWLDILQVKLYGTLSIDMFQRAILVILMFKYLIK